MIMANLDLQTLINDINEQNALESAKNLTYEEIINKLIIESDYPDDFKSDLVFFTTESFKKSPVASFMKELEEIKNAKPDEYTDSEEIKKFVDRNYDKLKNAAELLEKEPENYNKSTIHNLILVYSLILAAIPAMLVSLPVSLGVTFIGFALSIATVVVSYTRANTDSSAVKNLSKIKDGLKKINKDKLPESYQKRISRLITNIEDVEISFAETSKTKTESALNKEINTKKLAIYEMCANGEISLAKREEMLRDLKEDVIIDHVAESTTNDIKYNKARLLIYEKCANGEITEDTREVLLAKLKEKMNK